MKNNRITFEIFYYEIDVHFIFKHLRKNWQIKSAEYDNEISTHRNLFNKENVNRINKNVKVI